MSAIFNTQTLTVMECGKCGVSFALTDRYIAERREDHKTWYCPNGCPRAWLQENEAELLKRQLASEKDGTTYLRSRLDQERAEAAHQAARANGYKGALTKVKKRIGRGVCPCCNRHFADVERHMANKHADQIA